MSSKIISSLQCRAILKIGDVLCPQGEGFPRFSDLGVIEYIDVLLEEVPEQDLKDLKLLLNIFGILPKFAVRAIVHLLENKQDLNGGLGTLLRTVRFGLRGIVFSLYYSGLKGSKSLSEKTPIEVIGYEITMV